MDAEMRTLVQDVCRAVCWVEGLTPDEPIMEWESEAVSYRPSDPTWTIYATEEMCAALERIYTAGFEAAREAALKWADQFEAATRSIPVGHEDRAKGASTYGWSMSFLREVRAAIRLLEPRSPTMRDADVLRRRLPKIDPEFIVICASAWCNEHGVGVGYAWDGRRFNNRADAIKHGLKLRGSDDFNIGQTYGDDLIWIGWMDQRHDEDEETMREIAESIGLTFDPRWHHLEYSKATGRVTGRRPLAAQAREGRDG